VVELMIAGHEVFAIDNLCNSKVSVLERIEWIVGRRPGFALIDVPDRPALRWLVANHRVDAVIHFAGLKAVSESVEKPLAYNDNKCLGQRGPVRVHGRSRAENDRVLIIGKGLRRAGVGADPRGR